MEEISGCKSKGVERALGIKKQGGRGLLVDDPRVTTLPLPHHMDTVWVTCEAECVSTERCTKVDGHHDKMSRGAGWV